VAPHWRLYETSIARRVDGATPVVGYNIISVVTMIITVYNIIETCTTPMLTAYTGTRVPTTATGWRAENDQYDSIAEVAKVICYNYYCNHCRYARRS